MLLEFVLIVNSLKGVNRTISRENLLTIMFMPLYNSTYSKNVPVTGVYRALKGIQ
ncbi:hypothetical protein DFP93_10970 [Aneurinibacillus soli]|uniref:Uncharacterized protein n=1 Tax=Aneurinibacillus soli TaxID=1500254 RepID=A0A0U5AVN8_9BACL|nr:hypothetical protein DFP93_10970 [Aneurinibacillus soli]BAU27802.1 hypothetical protein CB4_01976 [Aneurinibacillus soli]